MAHAKGEILPPGALPADALRPRAGGAGGLFRDENLDVLSRVLDTWFRVPGTSIRFGLDGIVGFIPGLGDVLGGAASCVIILAAYFRGAAMVTVARMVLNVVIEVAVGAVPLVGNLFDIGWRANRRNYHLLERSLQTGKRDSWRDWAFMALLAVLLMGVALVPFALLYWLLHGVFGMRSRWV